MMRYTGFHAPNLLVGELRASLALVALASAILVSPLRADIPTTVLHAFSLSDGGDPHGSLIAVGDYLYGMTCYGGVGGGVIYRLNKNGSDFSVLHEFTSGTGYLAYGALVEVSGKLYGLTYGTTHSDMHSLLFNILPDGSGYQVLHQFDWRTEGGYAHGTPVHDNGFLYGFTGGGGPGSGGTIFRYEIADSTLDVLHAFSQSAPVGGVTPFGSPLVVDDVIYGMTFAGGAGSGGADGTLFRIGTDGSDFQVLHSFSGYEEDNGMQPYGDVIAIGDSLYGMTRLGGSGTSFGMGTIFRIHKTGTGFEILHRFLGPDYNPAGDDDGMEPYGSLTLHGSFLYGMTTHGGELGTLRGTIFRIRPDGYGYEILHHFAGGLTDGRLPYYATPLCDGNTLYTSTRMGGSVSDFGTVVSMELPMPVPVPETPAMLPPELSFALAGTHPAVGAVKFQLGLPAAARVELAVFDVAGRRVTSLVSGELQAGYHTVDWSSHEGGGPQAAGVYFARLTVGGWALTRRVVVQK